MLIYTLKRLLLAFAVTLVVSALSFGLLYLSGDPAAAVGGEAATEADIVFIRQAYGFDQPLYVQYLTWIGKAVRGDFGISYYFRLPVSQILATRLPVTLILGCLAILFALVFSIPLGVIAAMRPNTWIDRLALFLSVVGQAMPSFWLGLILIVIFSVWLPLLPPSGTEGWEYYIMPTVVLGYYAMPAIMRLTRAGMLEVLASDYIRTARAKGLLSGSILFKHALRNAVIPVVSVSAVQFGFMLGGSIVVETVFALQGMGYLAWESIKRSDFPTVQAVILIFAVIYIVLTFLADLLNGWLDPRIRVT
ncbi:MAG TPA: ABC transporter permease [Thermodesulfobacteriota bacterium]|nr:ABC transporter permease [Thermodesulfobacteriota bacterium]